MVGERLDLKTKEKMLKGLSSLYKLCELCPKNNGEISMDLSSGMTYRLWLFRETNLAAFEEQTGVKKDHS